MRKHGNGLRSIGVLCCLLLLLPLATLSAESNLYQDLMNWSDSFEMKLNSLEQRESRAQEIRTERDRRIQAVEWRIQRYESESRLGIPTTDDIRVIDEYIQALRDVTKQATFPWEVTWPDTI